MKVFLSGVLLFSSASSALAFDESNGLLGALTRPVHQSSVTAVQVEDKATQSEEEMVATKLTDLEKAFWICDYAQANGVIDAHEEAFCSAVTVQLRRVKFEGDMEKLLAWWQENKVTQHQELDRAFATAVEIERKQRARSAS